MEEIIQVPLSLLTSEGNIRAVSPEDTDVQALARSLSIEGQKVPIDIYPIQGNGHYGVRFGHRRITAAKALGWDTLTAVVSVPPRTKADLILDQYLENEHRSGLKYVEKANTYHALKDEGYSQEKIATILNVSPSDVSTAVNILRLPQQYHNAIEQGRISPSALEPLIPLSKGDQERLFNAVLSEKTARKVAHLVRADKEKSKTMGQAAETYQPDDDVDPMEVLAVDELRQATEHLCVASQIRLTYPALIAEAEAIVARAQACLNTILGG